MTFSNSSLNFESGSKILVQTMIEYVKYSIVPDLFPTCKYPSKAIPPDATVVSEAAGFCRPIYVYSVRLNLTF